jgi:alkyl hydroperoxide reductase subunit AhpC
MLSDFWPHGAVASAYGVFSEEVGIALRGSFLVDIDGVVRWTLVHGIPEARDVDEYIRAIEALQQAAL